MFILINILIRFLSAISNNINNELIISLTSNYENIKNVEKVIYSILKQNVDYSLYKIILFLSKKDFNKKSLIPKNLIILKNLKKIRIIIINNFLNYENRLIYAIKYYPNNPILLIGNNIIFPYGWLDMFIYDHNKYPYDAISGAIQYFFGKNIEIKEFIDGFKGEKYGIFNQVPDMIFNFAIINDLGGALYPKNYFSNKTFYDSKLFRNISKNSHEFWESCFIMIDNKILRQSSKIYDYTKYIINDSSIHINKILLYEKIKSSFLKYFPEFKKIIENRQRKIIISFTSHPKRFNLLSTLLKSIKNQTFEIKNIYFFLSEEEKKKYTLNFSEINLIAVKENLRPHKKYYYAMRLFREYAIITIDDDIFYSPETFESLFNSYLEYPNVISGRRSHYITYRKNGEFKKYSEWKHQQQYITNPDFNIFLTGNGGILYPPDILSINENDLSLIYETLTTDDITLKYFSYRKGISCRWVRNTNINGISGFMPKTKSMTLYFTNIRFNNDINIKKINSIYHISMKYLCISYKKLETGLTVYLFNIHNINKLNDKIQFNIKAFSYCYILKSMIINIYFDNVKVFCHFNYSKVLNINKYLTNKLIATCTTNSIIGNLNSYYFPKALSENEDINIKISNYRKHIRIIFKDFYCNGMNNCFLKALFYKSVIKGYYSKIKINNNTYICKLDKDIIFINKNNFPIERNLNCKKSLKKVISRITLSGLPKKLWIHKNRNNNVSNIFILSRIILDEIIQFRIILIGKLVRNLNNSLKNLEINYIYPNFTLYCYIESRSKEMQSYIYCPNDKKINSEILLENQVLYSENNNEILLLINEETFVEIDSNSFTEIEINKYSELNLKGINSKNDYNKINKTVKFFSFYDYFNIPFLILLSFTKFYFSFPYKKHNILKYLLKRFSKN